MHPCKTDTLSDTICENVQIEDKKMLTEYIKLIWAISLINLLDSRQCTSWAVYAELRNSFSKATVYRLCLRAEKEGLIENVSSNGFYDWKITDKGWGLYKRANKLPF